MTGLIVAAFMAVIAIALLAMWHGYHWRAERQARDRRRKEQLQRDLNRAAEWAPLRVVDAPYQDALVTVTVSGPFDWQQEAATLARTEFGPVQAHLDATDGFSRRVSDEQRLVDGIREADHFELQRTMK